MVVNVEELKAEWLPPKDFTLSEEGHDLSLADEVRKVPGGERIDLCFRCGTCTAGCTTGDRLTEYNPRVIINMAKEGMWNELAELSDVIWQCVNCNKCIQHCPKDARPADIIRAIWTVIKHRLPQETEHNPRLVLERLYMEQVAEKGRVDETKLARDFYGKMGRRLTLDDMMFGIKKIGLTRLVRTSKAPNWDKVKPTVKKLIEERGK